MPRLKIISADELVKFFATLGFGVIGQNGSHIKLRRILDGRKQTLIIPNHNPIRTGTLRMVYTQALAYVSDDILRVYFFVG